MAIENFSLAERPTNFRICLFGPTGVGKTTLLGTMPGRGLLIDVPQVEGGTFVISDKADRISGVRVREWDQIEEVYWAISEKDDRKIPGISRVNWIAIDSITGMQEMAKRKVIRERDRKLDADPHKITLPEYGQIGQLVGELNYRFCSLPYVYLITAQERRHGGGDDDPGPVQFGPDVIRSVLQAIKPPMTLMGRMGVTTNEEGKEQRTLQVGPPDGLYIVKARTPPGKGLPPIIRDPNLGEILRYVFANGPRPKRVRESQIIL